MASSDLFSSSRFRSARWSSVSGSAGGAGGIFSFADVGNGDSSFLRACRSAFGLAGVAFSGDMTTVSDVGSGDLFRASSAALALALPPIMPSFPGRLAFVVAGTGIDDIGREGSLLILSSCSGDSGGPWDFGESRACAGGEGAGESEGSFACFFLPPIMPNPPFGFFGVSRTCAGGEGAGEGDGEARRSGSFLFLPPILPNPPFGTFGIS